jgi:hypothetical protein
MKKTILILTIILIPCYILFAQQDFTNPKSPSSWGYFYKQIAPSAIPKCAEGKDTALGKITACVEKVTNALKYFSAILFTLMIVVIAGFFIFSPTKKDLIEKGKKALIYTLIGFIIIFVADEILKLIENLAK